MILAATARFAATLKHIGFAGLGRGLLNLPDGTNREFN
jgi:hypothetical protein